DLCGRYLQTTYGNNVALGAATAAGISFVGSNISGSFVHPAQINFRVPFRVAPSLINFWDTIGNPGKVSFSGGTGATQANNNGTSITGFAFNIGPNGFTAVTGISGVTSANFAHWAFSAEL